MFYVYKDICIHTQLTNAVISINVSLYPITIQYQNVHCSKFSCPYLWFYSLIMRNLSLTINISSVQFNHSVVSDFLQPHGWQHARVCCPSPPLRACSNSCPLSQWCHPTISFSIVPFSSCLQSFPASGSFPMSQFFSSGGQSNWSFNISLSNEYLGLISFRIGWISLQSKGLSRVFSNTTVQKHPFFGAQLSS